jgi:hypothetical protein
MEIDLPDNQRQILKLQPLLDKLLKANNIYEKLEIIGSEPSVKAFLKDSEFLQSYLHETPVEVQLSAKAIIAIGQGSSVFYTPDSLSLHTKELHILLYQLQEVEKFYDTIGGIVGYHITVLSLIQDTLNCNSQPSNQINYLKPEGLHIGQDSIEVRKAIVEGIRNLPLMGEIYPVGGAGDRLKLKHDDKITLLPAACLEFLGFTLLEGLIRDIQAREYLYYKLYGQQVITPLALMTSHEKENHSHIFEICERNRWFGRANRTFFLFIQPLAPVITKHGHWSLSSYLKLTLKPGGHGVIWKLALDNGVLDWFKNLNRKKILVRQINNPLGGTDSNLLALGGVGFMQNKSFGFASCPSLPNAAEGVDVLKEMKGKEYGYCISNVEYTEFSKRHVATQLKPSDFPSNTNILFADVDDVAKAAALNPIPGMLVNMKTTAPYLDNDGHTHEVTACRLESTMQNIADSFVDYFPKPISREEHKKLRTFINFNSRERTIAVTKRSYSEGNPSEETPEGAFFQLLKNNHQLFLDSGFNIPSFNSIEEFLQEGVGPSSLILFHPALGPLHSIVRQKVRKGKLDKNAECQLEIAELDIEGLDLNGSLLIHSDAVMGEKNSQDVLHYSELSGKCELYDVKIINSGINRKGKHVFWRNQIERNECLRIIIRGSGEFYAKGVIFKGNQTIEVPDKCRMIAYEKDGIIKFETKPISKPSWHWKYSIDSDYKINLSKAK